jgi:sensor c-di-GMP phosphodiesterase-like protein
MQDQSRRVSIIVVVTMLALVGGATCGYLLGRANTRKMTEARLAQGAAQVGELADSLLNESRSLLGTLNASPYPFCSEAEIAYFRKLIYHAENLRDAGRMRNGRLVCSALFGRNDLPNTQFQPSITQQDGMKFYGDLPPYFSTHWEEFVLQMGNSYVVEDPNFERRFEQFNAHVETTMIDASSLKRGRASGLPLAVPGAIKDRDWQGSLGDTLYATRCTPRSALCNTAYESFPVALWADRGQLVLYTALGGMSGASLLLVFVLLRVRNRSMSQQLRRAIRQDKLRVVYQPIVDLASGRIVEAEALARWTDVDGYAVSPEERGFVAELTELVVRHALSDFAEILREDESFRINVNVTASDLEDENFLPMLEQALARAGVEASGLAIEVTESATARVPKVIETISLLRGRGHSVQIDDFGTGYSSLAYLKDLAVDVVKIDRVFIQAIGTCAAMVDILPHILRMAEALNLQVIAEGIETVEQAAYFAGFEQPVRGQGRLFGIPVPVEEFRLKLAAVVR